MKGVEFGAGFGAAALHGSENNDPFYYDAKGAVRTRTNNAGGILGGITTGMPVLFPHCREAHAVDRAGAADRRSRGEKEAPLTIHGRHDPASSRGRSRSRRACARSRFWTCCADLQEGMAWKTRPDALLLPVRQDIDRIDKQLLQFL